MTATPEKTVESNPELLVAQFKKNPASSTGPKWLQQLRASAIASFAEAGFPTTRNEEWRFTSIAPILSHPLKPAMGASRAVTLEEIKPWINSKSDWPRLVFVDGYFSSQLSQLPANSKDFQVGSLRDRILTGGKDVEEHLGQHALPKANAFAALNTAFFNDGAYVSVAGGKNLEKPILLLFVNANADPGTISNPRTLIIAGEGSVVTVVEAYASLSDAPCLTNPVTELVLGANAQVEHCKIQSQSDQSFHISTIHANQAEDSQWKSHSISSGARLTRNQLETKLDGEGAEAILNGLYLGHAEQVVDHHTVVDHAKPHCESHEFYHGILKGQSHGIFNGKIFVREGAQKTNAKQNNRNLLLSDEATIDTKPQLEIFADDVKCTHGATIGQLNEEQLFYLRARGIGEDAARQMLIHAFAATVLERIQIEAVRAELDQTLIERLGNV